MKDGSIGKISENRFARADLEHILLCVDDDMRMEALRQTNYVKSIVTAQGKMDLERKGKQSYQGWMFARLMAFSNGDLQALYDRSDGFYRRQLVLTTKEKPAGRINDPDLAEKMKAEVEGIFLWAFECLQRLVANNFKFTESDRIRENREAVKRDNNNIFDFMDSEGYIQRKADASISSKDFYEIYEMWCRENSLTPLKARSFSESVIASQSKYNLEYCNKITNAAGRRVGGVGIEAIAKPNINGFSDVSERTYRRIGDDFSATVTLCKKFVNNNITNLSKSAHGQIYCQVILYFQQEDTSMVEIQRMQDNLLLIRRAIGWTASEFGEQIGVTRQTINNIESGRNKLTKTQYIAMRSVIDAEIVKHPEETEMVKILLDMLIDHPENYSKADYNELLEKANLMSPSILAGTATRETVSKEWMKTAGAVGAVVAGTVAVPFAGAPIVGAVVGGWLAKAVKTTDKKKRDK